MPDKLWLVVDKIILPMHEVSAEEMKKIRGEPGLLERGPVQSYPFYWAKGHGVYPHPVEGCRILKEITQDEI